MGSPDPMRPRPCCVAPDSSRMLSNCDEVVPVRHTLHIILCTASSDRCLTKWSVRILVVFTSCSNRTCAQVNSNIEDAMTAQQLLGAVNDS
eukprot:574834-Amphidinium_carterae.2